IPEKGPGAPSGLVALGRDGAALYNHSSLSFLIYLCAASIFSFTLVWLRLLPTDCPAFPIMIRKSLQRAPQFLNSVHNLWHTPQNANRCAPYLINLDRDFLDFRSKPPGKEYEFRLKNLVGCHHGLAKLLSPVTLYAL